LQSQWIANQARAKKLSLVKDKHEKALAEAANRRVEHPDLAEGMAMFKQYLEIKCCESCKALPKSARRLEPKDWSSKGDIRLKGHVQNWPQQPGRFVSGFKRSAGDMDPAGSGVREAAYACHAAGRGEVLGVDLDFEPEELAEWAQDLEKRVMEKERRAERHGGGAGGPRRERVGSRQWHRA